MIVLIFFAVTIVTLVVYLYWGNFRYWESKGIPVAPYFPIIGHIWRLTRGQRWLYVDEMYKKYKKARLFGLYEYFQPSLHVVDPDLVKNVLVKESDYFAGRRTFDFGDNEIYLAEMMFFNNGAKFKALRTTMTPTFTSAKIKAMFPLVKEKCSDFLSACEKEMNENSFVEIRALFGYYTLDVISSCAFGFDAKCLHLKEKSEFVYRAKNFMKFDIFTTFKLTLLYCFPSLYKFLGLTIMDKNPYLANLVKDAVQMRKKTGFKRADFLDVMIEAFDKSNEIKTSEHDYQANMTTLIAQSILFLIAGYLTLTETLSLTTYLLAKNPESQAKLREELRAIKKKDGEFNYQNIMEAPYLDACINESFRLLSTVIFLERICTKNYQVPDSDFVIPKGMPVAIPIYSLHRDPDYWSDPESFDPDRFLPENKDMVKPFTFLPFGFGPRNCIGMRFALMEVKIILAEFLTNYEVKVRENFELKLSCSVDTMFPNYVHVTTHKI